MKKFRVVTVVLMFTLVLGMISGCSTATQESITESADVTTSESQTIDTEESSQETTSEETITLRFGHGNQTDQLVHIYSQKWADLVEEATDGRIIIEIYPAGQAGTIAETFEAVSLGTLDICMGDPTMLGEYLPEFSLICQPFFIESFDHAERVMNSEAVGILVERLTEASNIHFLGFFWNGFRDICSKESITSIADCQNVLIRSPEADLYMNTFKTLGMSPTPIPWTDTYTAMEAGLADAMETNPEAILSYGFHNICKYVCKSHHLFQANGPAINESVWQSLSTEDQEILLDCLETAIAEERQAYETNDETVYSQLEAEGAILTEFEDRQELVDLFLPTWEEYAESCDAIDILNMLLEE